MPRQTAAQRHNDLPPDIEWPPAGEFLAAAITALAHPGRRRLLDQLSVRGPAPVGVLARATGMAPGSASHHLGVLARAGFITPAPELADDTRESWWRATARSLEWGTDTFAAGSAGEQLTELATAANLQYLLKAVVRWQHAPHEPGWDGTVSDAITLATPEQCTDLGRRLATVLEDWVTECRNDQDVHPDTARRPVRAIGLVFPEADGHGRS